MRIVSGKFKGRLITPPKNLRARPTTDFAKENLFNVLNNYVDFEDIDVLDLFSGTGSISYEFASREAKSVTSVEVNRVHYNFIKDSSHKMGLGLIVVNANCFLYLKSCKKQFDLIFADPPYDIDGSAELPDMIFKHDILRKDGILILEHSKNMSFNDHPNFWQQKSYGSVQFSFFHNSEY